MLITAARSRRSLDRVGRRGGFAMSGPNEPGHHGRLRLWGRRSSTEQVRPLTQLTTSAGLDADRPQLRLILGARGREVPVEPVISGKVMAGRRSVTASLLRHAFSLVADELGQAICFVDVQKRLAMFRQNGVNVHQLGNLLRYPLGDGSDQHASHAMADKEDVMQVFIPDDVDDIQHMGLKIDIRVGEVNPFAYAGQRWCVNVMSGRTQEWRDPLPTHTSTTVDKDKRPHLPRSDLSSSFMPCVDGILAQFELIGASELSVVLIVRWDSQRAGNVFKTIRSLADLSTGRLRHVT